MMTTEIEVRFVGVPDGQSRYIAEFGCETGTFTMLAEKCLDYHVPLQFRGDFKPAELANYDSEKVYRTDPFGRMLCSGFKKSSGENCGNRAVNRTFYCNLHGSRLHPLDRILKDEGPEELSRYEQFKRGIITVDDLDDEELALCGFRSSNGKIYRPKNIPRAMAQEFQKAIFEKAQSQLRSLTVEAVTTVGEIMKNTANEPDIRLKASLSIIERTLGKTPQVVALTTDKPFEEIFDDILHARSDESPTTVESSRPAIESRDTPLDVESFEMEQSGPLGTERHEDGNDVPSKSSGLSSGALHVEDSSLISSNNAEYAGIAEVDRSHDKSTDGNNVRDPRHFARNEAVISPVIEVKPFEYQIKDNTEDINKATRRRYASRSLGIDLTGEFFLVHREKIDSTKTLERLVDPDSVKVKTPSKKDVNKRKSFTINDFG